MMHVLLLYFSIVRWHTGTLGQTTMRSECLWWRRWRPVSLEVRRSATLNKSCRQILGRLGQTGVERSGPQLLHGYSPVTPQLSPSVARSQCVSM